MPSAEAEEDMADGTRSVPATAHAVNGYAKHAHNQNALDRGLSPARRRSDVPENGRMKR